MNEERSSLQGFDVAEPLAGWFDNVIRKAPVALAVVDRDLRYIAWSDRWTSDHGLHGIDLRGRYHDEVFPDDSSRWHSVRDRALAGETLELSDYQFTRTDGSTLWLRWQVTPVLGASGDVVGISFFTEDVTARKLFDLELTASEERLRLASDAAGFGMFEVNYLTGQSTLSASFLDMLGLRHHTPSTGIDGLIDLLDPAARADFHAARDRALDPGGDGRLSCQISPEIGGEARTFQLLAQVRFDGTAPDRRPARLIGVLIDQTESRRLAAALSRAQRLETVGRLAGGIAHDFNNLLSVILANLELGRMRVPDLQTVNLLDRAIEAAQMGAAFNKRLLALVGGRPTTPVAVDVNARLAEIWQILVRALGEDISVRLETSPHLPLIHVDPSELDGAILNLVVNARDAMPRGGEVTVATALVHVDAQTAAAIRGGRPGDFVRISVTDSGTGMPPEIAGRAFEPFFSTKSTAIGTGLGLTSVDSMASRAYGFATIDTTPGKGTTVAVCLPPTFDLPTDQAATGHQMPFGDGELVLVVEDNPQVREAVLQRLEVLGYAVLEAASADEALAMIEAGEPIRLVFTDVVMPGHLSGFDLVEHIRAHHPGIAVMLTSGHVSSRLADQQARLPDVEHLAKPYLLETLAQALRRALTASPEPAVPS